MKAKIVSKPKIVSNPKGLEPKAVVRSAEGCDYVLYVDVPKAKPKRKRRRKPCNADSAEDR